MRKILFFWSFMIFTAHAAASTLCVDALTPLLEDLLKKHSPSDTAKKLQIFLEKANDIALKAIEQSGSSIPQEKLQEFKEDFHGQLFDELLDFYTPITTD